MVIDGDDVRNGFGPGDHAAVEEQMPRRIAADFLIFHNPTKRTSNDVGEMVLIQGSLLIILLLYYESSQPIRYDERWQQQLFMVCCLLVTR